MQVALPSAPPLDVRSAVPVAVAAAAAGALALGALAALAPAVAVAAVVGAAAVGVAVARPALVAGVVAASMFAEAVSVGGLSSVRAAIALGVVAAGAVVIRHPVVLRPGPAGWMLFALASFATASLLWSRHQTGSRRELLSLAVMLAGAAVLAVLVRTRGDLRRLVLAVVVAAVGAAAWWIGSYAAGVDRFANPAGDPNHAALYLLLAAPLALAVAAVARSTAGRVAASLAAATLVVGTLATLSRGAAGALLVAVVVVSLLPATALFRSRRHRRAVASLAVGALVAAGAVVGPALAERFAERPEGSSVTGTRGHLWAAAGTAVARHPATGIGYGAFRPTSFDLLRTTDGVSLPAHLPEALREGRYVHNLYLEALAELGPVGLLLVVGVLIACLRTYLGVLRRARAAGDRFVGATAAALVVGTAAFASASLFLSTITNPALSFLAGLAVALPSVPLRPGAPT